jgi:hypothetical protein
MNEKDFQDFLIQVHGMNGAGAQFYIMQSRDRLSAEQLKRASDWALSKSASDRQAQASAYKQADLERAAAYKGATAEYLQFKEERRQSLQADLSAIESARRAAESQGQLAQSRSKEQLAAERRATNAALAAQERRDWEMAHQTEVERATLTEQEKQLLAYEANPLMYQVGVFNQALVTTAASYLSGAAEAIRKYAPMAMLGRYVEKTLGSSEDAGIAEAATLLGELAQVGPNFLAGVIDVPAAVEHTIREAGDVTRIMQREGVTTAVTHVTGTRQLMEAVFGYDVLTGEKVDRWAKAQEGLVRFSSTLMTIAGAMKAAGVDATLIPRPTPESVLGGMPVVGEREPGRGFILGEGETTFRDPTSGKPTTPERAIEEFLQRKRLEKGQLLEGPRTTAPKEPDVSYTIDSDTGLTIEAEGRITGPHPGRKKGRLPEPVGGRSPGEHRGHLIPEGGVDDPATVNLKENLISEAAHSNLGLKKSFDLKASRVAKENPGKEVRTRHRLLRRPGESRPYAVEHSIEVDGLKVYDVTIPNE